MNILLMMPAYELPEIDANIFCYYFQFDFQFLSLCAVVASERKFGNLILKTLVIGVSIA